jgi:hypothetical protein
MSNFREQSQQVKAEANALLERLNLPQIFKDIGEVKIVGSYAHDLMTDKDIDLLVVSDQLNKDAFYDAGGRIKQMVSLIGLKFEDRVIDASVHVPPGYYWGILTEDRWKLDIWHVHPTELDKYAKHKAEMFDKVDDPKRELILELKFSPDYKKKYDSMDVYRGILIKEIGSVAEFLEWVEAGGHHQERKKSLANSL